MSAVRIRSTWAMHACMVHSPHAHRKQYASSPHDAQQQLHACTVLLLVLEACLPACLRARFQGSIGLAHCTKGWLFVHYATGAVIMAC